VLLDSFNRQSIVNSSDRFHFLWFSDSLRSSTSKVCSQWFFCWSVHVRTFARSTQLSWTRTNTGKKQQRSAVWFWYCFFPGGYSIKRFCIMSGFVCAMLWWRGTSDVRFWNSKTELAYGNWVSIHIVTFLIAVKLFGFNWWLFGRNSFVWGLGLIWLLLRHASSNIFMFDQLYSINRNRYWEINWHSWYQLRTAILVCWSTFPY